MFNVTIVGYDQAYASAITGALDMFALAGVSWQRMQGARPEQRFRVQLASIGARPVSCINHLTLQANVALEDIQRTDLLLIPTIGGQIDKVLQANRQLLPHIQRLYAQGADVASNCSGAFFLAECGLLNGIQATTHWGYADLFALRYPQVDLQAEKMITQQDRIFCAGGGMAWFDLTLLLIERYCGHEVATNTAKAHVIDLQRGDQSAYASLNRRKFHQDKDIARAQDWIEQHYQQQSNINALAAMVNLSPRTFSRRFKSATGVTPLAYIQNVRIEQAKKQLEGTLATPEQITHEVGYEDISSFTRLFKVNTGLSPTQYRNKFKRQVNLL